MLALSNLRCVTPPQDVKDVLQRARYALQGDLGCFALNLQRKRGFKTRTNKTRT
jgi:hypothetical protein